MDDTEKWIVLSEKGNAKLIAPAHALWRVVMRACREAGLVDELGRIKIRLQLN